MFGKRAKNIQPEQALDYIFGYTLTNDVTASGNYFFSTERVIAEATKWFTMEPGDCIHTGTASKGTAKFPHGNIGTYLKRYDGKLTDVEIEQLGRLSNRIRMQPV